MGLDVRELRAGWGETVVLDGLSLTLADGECLGVLGRNGVGKSTFLETLMGHTRRDSGAILLDGADIAGLPPHRRARLGIGYVPQEREIFASLSVAENLELTARPGAWTLERVYALFPRLYERRHNGGRQLSGGEQQMLAVGRALLLNPRLLLLDEPSEGLAPVVVEALFAVLMGLRDQGMSVVLVEQRTALALSFAPRCLVMDRGRIVYDGAAEELRRDERKLHALVGVTGEATE